MSKRFTATNKWEDPWFFDLSPTQKIFWLYLLDRCDHAGIWLANWRLVKFQIGETPDLAAFEGRYIKISEEKWFIPKFVDFQYGQLNEDSRTHASVIAILKKQGVWEQYRRSTGTPKDKDKGLVKDKDSNRPTLEMVTAYCHARGNKVDPEKWFAYYESNGWRVGKNPMKNWQAAIRTWEKSEFNQPPAHAHIKPQVVI